MEYNEIEVWFTDQNSKPSEIEDSINLNMVIKWKLYVETRFHLMKMRYSLEPQDRICVKGYGFLSFAKNVCKSLSNKYGQKLFDSAKKSTADAIKTASKRAIQKTAEATGDLIGNKIADKITSISKKPVKELPNNDEREEKNMEITTHKKRYISPEERQQIIGEWRLVPKNYWC